MQEREKTMTDPRSISPRPRMGEIATLHKDIEMYSGWVKRLENYDIVLMAESNGKGIKLYDDCTRDAHASAVLNTRYMALSGCEWEIIPAGAPKRHGRPSAISPEQKVADFIRATLLDSNFSQMIQEIAQAILYGYYVTEVIWEIKPDNTIGIKKFITKHPRRFIFTHDRELRLLTIDALVEGIQIPDRKFIPFIWGSTDNPYGVGLGQRIWWPVWFKKNGIKYWMIYLEKFGMPTVKGMYPPGTSVEDQNALMDALEALQTDTGVKVPDTMQIELLEASRAGTATYDTLVEYMDRLIAKAVLGQTLTTDMGQKGSGGGSFAAAKVHNELRKDILKSDADVLCEIFNGTLIKWLVDFNFPSGTAYPKIWFHTDESSDLLIQMQRDTLLLNAGLKIPEAYFYNTYDIPQPEANEPCLGGANDVKQDNISMPSASSVEKSFADAPGTAAMPSDQAAVENARIPDADLFGAALQPVIGMIQAGKSFPEIIDKLLALYPDMDMTQFETMMERAVFAAQLWGRISGER